MVNYCMFTGEAIVPNDDDPREALFDARKNARGDRDAAAIAWAEDRIAELEGMVYSLRAALQPLAHQLLNENKIDPNAMYRLVLDIEDADLIGQDVLNARACIKSCTVK